VPLNYRQQIEQFVDEGIRAGNLSAQFRSKYIEDFSNDPKAAEWFAGGFMRYADYTNKQKERAEMEKQAHAAIAAERSKVESERQRLTDWERQARAEIDRLRSTEGESARYRQAVAQYQQVLKDFNLTDHDPLSGQPAPSMPTPSQTQPPSTSYQPPTTDQTRWVSQTEAVETIGRVVDLQGELLAIAAEHQFLHGQPLRENLIQEAKQAGQLGNIRSYWEHKYNIPGKRAELEEKNRNEEYDRIRREEREKVLSELAADPSRIVQPGGIWQPEASPLASNYMASRAAAHNPVSSENRQSGTPAGQTERRLPEQISHVESKRSSVEAAANYFNKHYTPDGTPINRGDNRTQ
jgi:hypothetical protein